MNVLNEFSVIFGSFGFIWTILAVGPSSVRPSVRRPSFVRPFVRRPSICLSVCPSIRPSVRPFVRPSVRPFVRPSAIFGVYVLKGDVTLILFHFSFLP